MSCALPPTESAPSRPPLPGKLRWWGAVVGGMLTGLAFAPIDWWPLLFIGPAIWLVLAVNQPASSRTGKRPTGFGLGYAFGLGFMAVGLNWLRVLVPGVGPVLAVVLIAFEAVFFGLLGWLSQLTRRLPWWPLWTALAWGLVEFIYGRVPFGGFGWMRLAYGALDTPIAGFLPFVGVSGVSMICAGLASGLAWAYLRWRPNPRAWMCVVTPVLGVAFGVVALGVALNKYEPEPAAGSGTIRVGMVQGDIQAAGVGGVGRARAVTENHLSESITLMAKARTGTLETPDFLLWPENSTDIDPRLDGQTFNTVRAASKLADRPIFVGAISSGPGPDERQTTGMWWMPDQTVTGEYHKRNLVPFGEYVPFRDQLVPLIPLLELVGAQSIPGPGPGIVNGTLGDGTPVAVGDVICFELAYDQTVREAADGSEVLMVQSNNAAYRGTAQPYQQFAITRARAMETRREIVVATTNSLSGYIDRFGVVQERTREMTSAHNVYAVPRRTAVTPAVKWGAALEHALVGLGLVASVTGFVLGSRRVTGGSGTESWKSKTKWAAEKDPQSTTKETS